MIREAGCNEVDGRRVSLQLGIWTMGRLRVRGILLDTYLGGGRVGTREIIPGESDMKGAGSFHIHRKIMKELGALAVLGIRERPNLAQNLVTHRH